MEHTVNDYMEKVDMTACTLNCVNRAKAMALSTIHAIYDENNDKSKLSDIDLDKVKDAMCVLEMAHKLTKGA